MFIDQKDQNVDTIVIKLFMLLNTNRKYKKIVNAESLQTKYKF